MPATFQIERLPTPIGELLIIIDAQERLRAVSFEDHTDKMFGQFFRDQGKDVPLTPRSTPSPAKRALEAYFAGDLSAIDTVAVETGGTPFQREVWTALREIPLGQTMSYGALAAKIGRPKAVRAVGLTNGANPVSIVVPCHRVIGSDSSLTGYGGGLERKLWLLEHEGVLLKIGGGAKRPL